MKKVEKEKKRQHLLSMKCMMKCRNGAITVGPCPILSLAFTIVAVVVRLHSCP